MDNVKRHFEEDSYKYNQIIVRVFPYYNEMLEALVDSILLDDDASFDMLDLGCGPGVISKLVLNKYPNAKITCVDIATNMLELAKNALSEYKDTEFINEDFYNLKLTKKYDVVFSSLALHHLLNDNDKKAFYKIIYNNLNENGLFFNADLVLASDEKLNNVFINKWIEYLQKSATLEEINNKHMARYYEEDRPAVLLDQLLWLKDIGYRNVDVIWKYYNTAVYGGYK